MRSCPECGNHNDSTSNFCGQCGTRVANVCRDCGFENLLNQPFCGSCGKQLIKSDTTSPEKKSPELTSALPLDFTNQPLAEDYLAEDSTADFYENLPADYLGTHYSPEEAIQPDARFDEFEEVYGPIDTSYDKSEKASEPVATAVDYDAFSQAYGESADSGLELDPEPVFIPDPRPGTQAHVLDDAPQPLPGNAFQYSPPVYGQFRSVRQAQIVYDAALHGLTQDIKQFLDSESNQGKGQFIALASTDGLGKSHMMQMARLAVDPDGHAFWLGGENYRCYAPSKLLAQGWLEVVRNLINQTLAWVNGQELRTFNGLGAEGQPELTVKAHIQQFLEFVYDGQTINQELFSFLCDWFSANPMQQLQVETADQVGAIVDYLQDLLLALAAKRPVALLFEDLQFADVATLDILYHLLRRDILGQAPILILASHTRDFYFSGAFEKILQQVRFKEYVISDFSDAEIEAFLNDGPLGGQISQFPVLLLNKLIERSHGLPIYIEELLHLMRLKGLLFVDPNTQKFTPGDMSGISNAHLPDSLPEIIQERLSFLTAQSRYILQLASVLGERFPIALLLSLSQYEDSEFNQTLNTLLEHRILIPDAAGTGRFRHGLIWRSVYNHIEPELKRQLHQLVSQTLENDYSQGLTVNPSLMAYHAEQGHLPNRALAYWNLAGVHAAQIGSITGMNHAFFRALELIDVAKKQPLIAGQQADLNELEDKIFENLGLFNVHDNPELSMTLLKRIINNRKARGENTALIEPYGFLARCYENLGDVQQAMQCIDIASQLFSKTDNPLEYASLIAEKIDYLNALGLIQEARHLLETTVEPVFTSHPLDGEPKYFNTYMNARLIKAQIMLEQCDLQAFDVIHDSLILSREKNLEGLGIAFLLTQGHGYLRRGDYERCDQEADAILQRIEALDDPDWFLAQWGLLALEYHCAMGDWDSAKQLMLTVVAKAEQAKDYQTSIMAQIYGGYVAYQLGQTKKAHQLLEHAVTESSERRYARCALVGWRYLAEVEANLGNNAVALEIAQNALTISKKPDIQHTAMRFNLTQYVARCLMVGDNIKEAGRMLETLWPEVLASKCNPAIAETAFCIGELYKNMAALSPSEVSKKHLVKSVQFYQKSQGVWLDCKNRYKINQVRQATPNL